MREILALLSADIGKRQYQRRQPDATDDEALSWGIANRHRSYHQAVDLLVALQLVGDGDGDDE